jgi:filamentous hemagglutinin family protein
MFDCRRFRLAFPSGAVAQGVIVSILAIGIPLVCHAGNHGTGPILMNPAAAARMQWTAIGLQLQNAQAAIQNLAQTGISVIKGNNGVTFIRIKEPTLSPSAVLRTLQSNGKTYAIDGNGIIFGGSNPVNTRALSAAAMGATSNGVSDVQTKKLTKPQGTDVPSIITTEVVRFGQ